jgi:hypothetical protein
MFWSANIEDVVESVLRCSWLSTQFHNHHDAFRL